MHMPADPTRSSVRLAKGFHASANRLPKPPKRADLSKPIPIPETLKTPSATAKAPAPSRQQVAGNLPARYRPQCLAEIVGHEWAIRSLSLFVAAPYSTAFVFHGPSGVGKTVAAWALANELGCDPDWGGVIEVPSGTQDGRAVAELLDKLRLRPLAGSGWKVVIVNEADRMTEQAEAIWLDGLERLPAKTVVVFTTNNVRRLTDRFLRRCEVYRFDGASEEFRMALEEHVRSVIQAETGRRPKSLPEGLGKFEAADDSYSIGLALQQIAPYLRSKEPLPASIEVPFIRGEGRSLSAPKAKAEKPSKPAKAAEADPFPAPYRVRCQCCGEWAQPGELVAPFKKCAKKIRWKHAKC